jgi:hypothetical protein
MVTVDDRRGHLASGSPLQSTQSLAHTRRQWVTPSWERLETPMEVTMYAGRR